MQKIIYLLLAACCINIGLSAQSIPYGTSVDSLLLSDGNVHQICYYKPLTYDSLTSDILWGLHGQGASGFAEINDLAGIAERRHTLIVAPTDLSAGWGYIGLDTVQNDTIVYWAMDIYREIYRHVLAREQRDTMWVHLIGFSAGGQGVTRYMLLRQAFPDSIPIRMAVSANPMFYAFATDFLNGSCMAWPCGLGIPSLPFNVFPLSIVDAYFICNEHVVQYYNENYAVLIGTADNAVAGGSASGCPCLDAEGNGRYQRAVNFYNFSLADAPLRNTTLQWQYKEIAGVAHDQNLMYLTKENVTDSSTIAETLLFDIPYHNVPSLAPIAGFYADTNLININGTINFTNTSINATSYIWDFGDGVTSTLINPSHIYTYTDTFTVSLIAIGGSDCRNLNTKREYIIVKNPVSVNEINESELQIKIYPNPVTDKVSIMLNNPSAKNLQLILYDVMGKEQKRVSFTQSIQMDITDIAKGIYLYKIFQDNNIFSISKIIRQ